MQRKIKRRYAYGKEQYGCQSLDEGQVQRYRDIVMQWKKGPYLALLACESQSGVHYAMPVRNMLYDSLSYTEQIRKMLKNYVPDYRINLVDVGKIHDPEKFTSDLQLIFGMLKYRGDMRELQKYMDRHREYFQNVDADTYRAAREMLHAGGVMESMREEKDRKEGDGEYVQGVGGSVPVGALTAGWRWAYRRLWRHAGSWATQGK